MATQMFRCLSCADPGTGLPGVGFDAQKPVCPKCGADRELVQKVETIHYDPPSGHPGRGLRRAACDPKIVIGPTGVVLMTGEPAAVTCRACKATPVWKLEADMRGLPVVAAGHDFEVGPAASPRAG